MKATIFVFLAACGTYDAAYVDQAIADTQSAIDAARVMGPKTHVRIVSFAMVPVSITYTGCTVLQGDHARIEMTEAYDKVLYHEIGHALGLDHVDNPRSIMNAHVPDMPAQQAINQLVEACRGADCWRLNPAEDQQ